MLCYILILTMSTVATNLENTLNLPQQINGWQLETPSPKKYNAENLFDYIDGNAEVYRALGVQEVLVYRYKNTIKEEIIIDIFDMGSSASAYGAYHNDIRDLPDANIGNESELMSNSLTFWKDKYFIVITGIGESENMKQTILKIGKHIDEKIPNKGEPPHLIYLLPEEGLVKSEIYYFKNYDLLKVRFYLSDYDPFELKENCEGLVARYKLSNNNENFILFLVSYPSEKDAKKALKNLKELSTKEYPDQGYTKNLSHRNTFFFTVNNYLVLIVDFNDKNVVKTYKEKILALMNKRRNQK